MMFRSQPVEMTDCEFLRWTLRDGEWHSLNDVLRRSFAERGCGLTVHSRVSDLRAQGHRIEHRMVGRRGDGSQYRLLSEGETKSGAVPAVPQTCSADSQGVGVSAFSPSLSKPVQLQLVPERRGAYTGGVCT